MTKNEIVTQLRNIGDLEIDFDLLLNDLSFLKSIAISEKNQEAAKEIWILEQIAKIHHLYRRAFELLQDKSYYEAWCKLETIEIKFISLKKHFVYNEEAYKLHFIERSVTNLQTIFPYQLFFSSEILEIEKKCNICDQILTVRKSCGHKKGEIYNGELCIRIISKSKLLGIAVVENPVHKYSVVFTSDSRTNDIVDQYNYAAIEYLMELLDSAYEEWDLEVQYQNIPHFHFKNYSENDLCPCGSREKYGECCLEESGVKFMNYEFIVANPSSQTLLTNTTR